MAVSMRSQVAVASTGGAAVVAGKRVPVSDSVKILGVTVDSFLSFDQHATNILRCCNYHLRSLRHIRPLKTCDVSKGGSLQYGVCQTRLVQRTYDTTDTDKNLKKTPDCPERYGEANRQTSATQSPQTLHWLPIKYRIDNKIATTVNKLCQNTFAILSVLTNR